MSKLKSIDELFQGRHFNRDTPSSSGQAEGQINKLKLLKRQTYGRACFYLLRRRVLLAT